jgi:uncharacterized protein involved in outer membrane biogenesis
MKLHKLRLTLLIGLPLLAVALVAGYYFALHTLKQQIVTALGQTGEMGELRVNLSHIQIDKLRIKASRAGWPTPDEFRADQVRITPDLRSLLSGTIEVQSITVENAAMTVLRGQAGVKILPALLEKPNPRTADAASPSGPNVHIHRITMRNSRVDFYDATVAARRLHIPLDQIELTLKDLQLPAMDEAVALQLQARVAAQGRLDLTGQLVPANMTSDLRLKLSSVPVKLLEPYLFKGKAGEVRGGSLAMDMHAKVVQRKLNAPGHLTLTQLELGGLSGLAREALAAFARAKGLDADTKRPVDLDFTLQGNLDDSRFSLNDAIYAQGGLAVLKLIGLGGSGDNADKPGAGIVNAIQGLFGK